MSALERGSSYSSHEYLVVQVFRVSDGPTALVWRQVRHVRRINHMKSHSYESYANYIIVHRVKVTFRAASE